MKIDVSIAVIAYNSSKTITQTLDSIANQSFDLDRVEVVISDDCSTDNTVQLVKNWVLLNRKKIKTIVTRNRIK
jgi:glycosyltransferase involved in cell wall biosynthesis